MLLKSPLTFYPEPKGGGWRVGEKGSKYLKHLFNLPHLLIQILWHTNLLVACDTCRIIFVQCFLYAFPTLVFLKIMNGSQFPTVLCLKSSYRSTSLTIWPFFILWTYIRDSNDSRLKYFTNLLCLFSSRYLCSFRFSHPKCQLLCPVLITSPLQSSLGNFP